MKNPKGLKMWGDLTQLVQLVAVLVAVVKITRHITTMEVKFDRLIDRVEQIEGTLKEIGE